MGLYVEVMCDRQKAWPDKPEYAARSDFRCESDKGDNPQGRSVGEARVAARKAGWLVARNHTVCPGCRLDLDGD